MRLCWKIHTTSTPNHPHQHLPLGLQGIGVWQTKDQEVCLKALLGWLLEHPLEKTFNCPFWEARNFVDMFTKISPSGWPLPQKGREARRNLRMPQLPKRMVCHGLRLPADQVHRYYNRVPKRAVLCSWCPSSHQRFKVPSITCRCSATADSEMERRGLRMALTCS